MQHWGDEDEDDDGGEYLWPNKRMNSHFWCFCLLSEQTQPVFGLVLRPSSSLMKCWQKEL